MTRGFRWCCCHPTLAEGDAARGDRTVVPHPAAVPGSPLKVYRIGAAAALRRRAQSRCSRLCAMRSLRYVYIVGCRVRVSSKVCAVRGTGGCVLACARCATASTQVLTTSSALLQSRCSNLNLLNRAGSILNGVVFPRCNKQLLQYSCIVCLTVDRIHTLYRLFLFVLFVHPTHSNLKT